MGDLSFCLGVRRYIIIPHRIPGKYSIHFYLFKNVQFCSLLKDSHFSSENIRNIITSYYAHTNSVLLFCPCYPNKYMYITQLYMKAYCVYINNNIYTCRQP